MNNDRNLQIRIEELRNHLALVAAVKGYTHRDTIQISQQLDMLLNQLNQMKYSQLG